MNIMSEEPILFNSQMIEAVLNEHKTQTRRVVNGEPFFGGNLVVDCPYGQPGDLLWVRETWAVTNSYDDLKPRDIPMGDDWKWPKVWYNAPLVAPASIGNTGSEFLGRTRPSKFMPRWASRINLLIKDVRVERIQDIDYLACFSEGLTIEVDMPDSERHEAIEQNFETLWNSINAKRGYSWGSNPWVWVVEFKLSN